MFIRARISLLLLLSLFLTRVRKSIDRVFDSLNKSINETRVGISQRVFAFFLTRVINRIRSNFH